jgi:cob(I)alamin adenosyltransferase
MSLYTRTGDGGTSGLIGGKRLSKGHLRFEAAGCLDELNGCLGLAIQCAPFADMRENLRYLQHKLFTLGAVVSTPTDAESKLTAQTTVDESLVRRLEEWIDQAEAQTPPIRHFILPGGTETACRLHHARAVCRRAERVVVRLAESESVNRFVLIVLNRLSDLLFAWARLANHRDGVEDVIWQKDT